MSRFRRSAADSGSPRSGGGVLRNAADRRVPRMPVSGAPGLRLPITLYGRRIAYKDSFYNNAKQVCVQVAAPHDARSCQLFEALWTCW